MSLFSDRSRSNSNEILPSENGGSGCFKEWGEDIYGESFLDYNSEFKIILLANNRQNLFSIFQKYNFSLEEQYNSTGWTHKSRCPFPDHRDSTASFGYNSKEDRFNCFGCNRSGRAVQFISYMTNKPLIDVARQIIDESSEKEQDELLFSVDQVDFREIEDNLLDYADYVREFKRSNNCSVESMKYAEDLTWNLDLYLRGGVPVGVISLESLKARIEKIKKHIERFGDPE